MDTKSTSEGSISGNAHVKELELWKRWCWNILLLIEGSMKALLGAFGSPCLQPV
jgi:hypothetical protein